MINNAASPPGRFPGFIDGLLKAIGCHNKVVAGWLCLYIFTRVRRIEARVNKLLEKLRAGTYRAPKPRAPRSPDAPRKERPKPDPRAWVFPNIASVVPADARKPGGGFGWVNRLLQDPARPYTHIYTGPASAGFLHIILQQDAEIREFARTCPALARQLRPLCHMLGLTPPDYLKLPPRPRKPRPPKPPRVKRAKQAKFAPSPSAKRTVPLFSARRLRFAKKRANGDRAFE